MANAPEAALGSRLKNGKQSFPYTWIGWSLNHLVGAEEQHGRDRIHLSGQLAALEELSLVADYFV